MGIAKFKYERKNEMNSGSCSQIRSSSKCPIVPFHLTGLMAKEVLHFTKKVLHFSKGDVTFY